MAPVIPGRDLALDPGQNQGPVPTEVHAGTTPALVPAPTLTGATPGAVLVAGNIADEGATADPQCQIVADTLATGPTQTPTAVWACLD